MQLVVFNCRRSRLVYESRKKKKKKKKKKKFKKNTKKPHRAK